MLIVYTRQNQLEGAPEVRVEISAYETGEPIRIRRIQHKYGLYFRSDIYPTDIERFTTAIQEEIEFIKQIEDFLRRVKTWNDKGGGGKKRQMTSFMMKKISSAQKSKESGEK